MQRWDATASLTGISSPGGVTLHSSQARESWLILRRGHTTWAQYFHNNMKINIFLSGAYSLASLRVSGVSRGEGTFPSPWVLSCHRHARRACPSPGCPARCPHAQPTGAALRRPPAPPAPVPPRRSAGVPSGAAAERGGGGTTEGDVPSKCSEVAARFNDLAL